VGEVVCEVTIVTVITKMAVQLNFNREKVFWRIAKHGKERDRALAFEACAALLTQLQYSAFRLEQTLLSYSKDGTSFDALQTLGDIHQIITVSHRIYNLYPLLLANPTSNTQKRIKIIASLYNSFEDVSVLIKDCFTNSTNSYSVLGDFLWRYRARVEDSAAVYLFKGSMLKAGAKAELNLNEKLVEAKNELNRFDGHTGIFGVEFIYVQEKTMEDGSTALDSTSMIIDDLITGFNNLVANMESSYSILFQAQMAANTEWFPDTSTVEPLIIRLK
jgi:hypothetical protein